MRKEVLAEGVELYCGDCREILSTLGRFGAVVTDPPYGIKRANGMGGGGGGGPGGKYLRKPRRYAGDWDSDAPNGETFAQILKLAEAHIIWGGNFFSDVLPRGGKWLVWDKLNSMPSYSDIELAWTSIDGTSVKKFTACASGLAANRDGRVHPTQKPLRLMEWCLGFVEGARIVIDPYMGSGTTGVAAVKLGRKFTGIEIDEKYFAIACKRISAALKQPDFFVAAPSVEKPKQDAFL